MQTLEQTISEQTGFDLGDRFDNSHEVRGYFDADVQRGMFGEDAITDQEQLDAWAEQVVAHGWHMTRPGDAVEVAIVSHDADRAGATAQCLAALDAAGVAVWQECGEGIVAWRLSVRPDDAERATAMLAAQWPSPR